MNDKNKSVSIQKIKDYEYKVTVAEYDSLTVHTVIMDDQYYRRLTQGHITRIELIRLTFGYILQRESKESILARFDLRDVQRRYPEYEKELSI